jgi:hypothetical protein
LGVTEEGAYYTPDRGMILGGSVEETGDGPSNPSSHQTRESLSPTNSSFVLNLSSPSNIDASEYAIVLGVLRQTETICKMMQPSQEVFKWKSNYL